MSVIRPFEATDVLRFNTVNADAWTATYHNGYYTSYLARWPDFCVAVEGAHDPSIRAYMIAKHEPPPPDTQHHGHLTALSVAPAHRAAGLARVLMDMLERLSSDGTAGASRRSGSALGPQDEGQTPGSGAAGDGEKGEEARAAAAELASAGAPNRAKDCVDAFFVDLFVRCNNARALDLYGRLGYSVFRRVVDYYQGMEGIGSTRDELDGYDMRKSMPKDTAGKYVRANGKDILVSPEQVWA